MTVRRVIGRALATDAGMNGLGITTDSLWSGDTDTPPTRPYIVLRWGNTNPGVGDSRVRPFVVWVHDNPNNYDRIDAIIRRIRYILTETIHGVQTSTGWITTIDWETDSDDLSDQDTHTILRTSTYTVIASGM